MYEKSNDAIDQGDVQVFVEKYLQAIQLQREEQRSLGMASFRSLLIRWCNTCDQERTSAN